VGIFSAKAGERKGRHVERGGRESRRLANIGAGPLAGGGVAFYSGENSKGGEEKIWDVA